MPVWLYVGNIVLGAVVAVLLFSHRVSFRGGGAVADYQALVKRVDAHERRLDQAGEKVSTLASEVQGWETRARVELLTRAEATLMLQESRDDRTEIRRRLIRLEEERTR